MQEKTAWLSKTDQQKTTKFDIEIKLKQKFIFETKVHPVRGEHWDVRQKLFQQFKQS